MKISRVEKRFLLARPASGLTSALFLDRDGVIIEERHHISNPALVQLCSGAWQLIHHAMHASWPVVVITNQSGIARGLLSWQEFEAVTSRMLEMLGPKAPIAAIYANGHGPGAPPQSWRKPSPAMLYEAAGELNLDLSRSILIGDRLSDLRAGASAGLPMVCHVLSGHGERERPAVQRWCQQLAQAAGTEFLPPASVHAGQPVTASCLASDPSVLMLPNLNNFPLQLLASLPIDRS